MSVQFGIYVIDNDKIALPDGATPTFSPDNVRDALLAAVQQAGAVDQKHEAEIQSLQDRLAKQRKFLDDLVADAHEYADDNGLCYKFDQFMEKHGLPGRKRTYRIELSRTVTESYTETAVVYVEASSEGAARDAYYEGDDDVNWSRDDDGDGEWDSDNESITSVDVH